jgi:hypothetical protein
MAIGNIEFLRYLIDFIDGDKGGVQLTNTPTTVEPAVVVQAPPMDFDDEVDCEVDPEDEVDTPLDRDDVFIPPLQTKIEIMKKMAGIDAKNQDLLSSDEEDEPFDG